MSKQLVTSLVAILALIFVVIVGPNFSRADTANSEAASPGARMADGTIYVGVSPSNGLPLFVMPQDIEGEHSFSEAHLTAAIQTFGGHSDWRVPSIEELDHLYQQKEIIGGFSRYWYWSSTDYNSIYAWHYDFGIGYQSYSMKDYHNRVRYVRSG